MKHIIKLKEDQEFKSVDASKINEGLLSFELNEEVDYCIMCKADE